MWSKNYNLDILNVYLFALTYVGLKKKLGSSLTYNLLNLFLLYLYYQFMYLNSSSAGRIWHKVNCLKRSKAGLNFETSCLPKVREPNLPYYLLIVVVGGNRCIHAFHKCISAAWNANSFVEDLNSDGRVHFQQK